MSILLCIQQAWSALLRNVGPFFGVAGLFLLFGLGLGVTAGAFSLISPRAPAAVVVVGYVGGIPALMWGFMRFTLNAIDGRARAMDLLNIFERFWSRLGRVTVVWLAFVVIQLPGIVPQVLLQLSGDVALSALGFAWSTLWSCAVALRFGLSFFFLVDGDMSGVDALRSSWERTRGNVLRLFGLLMAAFAMTSAAFLPATLLWLGAAVLGAGSSNLALTSVASGLLLIATFLPVFGITCLIMPAAFRQIVGRVAPATAAPDA